MSREELTRWARESQQLWLFLDYDGTLSDFALTPDDIQPNPEIITLLERLARRPNTHVTVLSGRRLGHIRQLLPVSGIILSGTYGIELLEETGEMTYRVEYEDIRPALEEIKPHWAQLIHERQGFFLEDKEWALALHARFANDEESAQIIGQALEFATLNLPSNRFRILGGHKFLEVAPRLASKKETVEYLLSRYAWPDARLLYIGDDDKDEEAFPIIQAHQGLAVKVVQPSQIGKDTTADFFFHSPADTLSWLNEIL
ncbi:MAG TPA: trehalose-phosphatase [Anaerolineales bacterium]|nr:trehalose-phosphatase [Anaerolineales bacterium]